MRSMLEAYGFGREWIEWIMNLVTSTFFFILVNGVPYGTFIPLRGIRQGDSLSPFLFILMAEGLGRSIVTSRDNDDIRGIQIYLDAAKQTHQQFVDDMRLTGYPSVQESWRFKKCLMDFGIASGLETNE